MTLPRKNVNNRPDNRSLCHVFRGEMSQLLKFLKGGSINRNYRIFSVEMCTATVGRLYGKGESTVSLLKRGWPA